MKFILSFFTLISLFFSSSAQPANLCGTPEQDPAQSTGGGSTIVLILQQSLKTVPRKKYGYVSTFTFSLMTIATAL